MWHDVLFVNDGPSFSEMDNKACQPFDRHVASTACLWILSQTLSLSFPTSTLFWTSDGHNAKF